MKQKIITLGDHLLPMLLSALAAASLTFLQKFVSQTGICVDPTHPIAEASSLGAAFKGLHSLSLFFKK
jgi:hypothetical protein